MNRNVTLKLSKSNFVILFKAKFLLFCQLITIDKCSITGIEILNSNLVIFERDFEMRSTHRRRIN